MTSLWVWSIVFPISFLTSLFDQNFPSCMTINFDKFHREAIGMSYLNEVLNGLEVFYQQFCRKSNVNWKFRLITFRTFIHWDDFHMLPFPYLAILLFSCLLFPV